MIKITDSLSIPKQELEETFIRASGPGGQNVNKVATAVQLRFDVANSPSLPEHVRTRLKKLAGKRLSADGVLTIVARRYRTQEQNRTEAADRLADLIRRASQKPKLRRATKPTRRAKERRLKTKHRRGDAKRLRQSPDQE